MNELRVSRSLALPIDVVGESTAILAKKGAGKSNTAKVIVEETLDHGGVQVVVLDPIGHWWSLRAGADGKPKGGYPVAVFGGMHGDLPLEATAGKLLAQTAVESGQSMILDVSSLDSTGAMQRFVYDFLTEFYKLKQATPTPTLLVLEEADEFAPQDTRGPNATLMVGAANRISKRGRGRGIGMLYVTQRSAALNKNVLDQSDTLVVMRTIGPRDRAAIEGWVKYQQADGFEDVLPSLPSLETGEAWVWTPERGLLARVKIRKARTFDSSQTPRPGESAVVADVKPIDVEKLGEAIKATVERARENDPAELRKRIRELERQLRQTPTPEPQTVEVERIVEVSALTEADRVDLERVRIANDAVTAALEKIATKIEANGSRPAPAAHADRPAAPTAAPTVAVRPPAPSPPVPSSIVVDDLSTGAKHLLATLGQSYPMSPTVGQLALLARRKARGGAWNTSMKMLRDAGLIVEEGGEVTLTYAGREAAGVEDVGYLSPQERVDRWRSVLPVAALDLFDLLVAAHPLGRTVEELAEVTGRTPRGGSWNTAVSTIVRCGLARRDGDTLYATDAGAGMIDEVAV